MRREIRRRCEERLKTIRLPVPFDAYRFRDQIALATGRSIEIRLVAMPAGPHGAWVRTSSQDYIFCEARTSRLHQQHIILHELCHILLNHHGIDLTDSDVASSGFPLLSTETLERLFHRGSYTSEEDQEAEMLASLIMRRVGLIEPEDHLRPERDEALRRLEVFYEDTSESESWQPTF